jgi:hypothetical protein
MIFHTWDKHPINYYTTEVFNCFLDEYQISYITNNLMVKKKQNDHNISQPDIPNIGQPVSFLC